MVKLFTLRLAAIALAANEVSARVIVQTAEAHAVKEIDDEYVVVVNRHGKPLYTYLGDQDTRLYTSIQQPSTIPTTLKSSASPTSKPTVSSAISATHTPAPPSATAKKSTLASKPGSTYTFVGSVASPPPPQTNSPMPTNASVPSSGEPTSVVANVPAPSSSVLSGPDDSTIFSCDQGAEHPECQAALSQHNNYRGMHSAPTMTWDSNLAAMAAASLLATPCVMADYIELGDVNTGFQSNAAAGYTDLAGATGGWYDEINTFIAIGGFGESSQQVTNSLNAYNVAHGTSIEVGHMVNVIFKAHTGLGCAWSTCPNGVQIGSTVAQGATTNFLCLYSPYALYYDSWPENLSAN